MTIQQSLVEPRNIGLFDFANGANQPKTTAAGGRWPRVPGEGFWRFGFPLPPFQTPRRVPDGRVGALLLQGSGLQPREAHEVVRRCG